MAFTRFHDDPCRIIKHLEESTNVGLYYLNTPGNGTRPPFIADPHIRLQFWGANRASNFTDIEGQMKGLKTTATAVAPRYPTTSTAFTSEPRAEEPAWTLRDVDSTIDPLYPTSFRAIPRPTSCRDR